MQYLKNSLAILSQEETVLFSHWQMNVSGNVWKVTINGRAAFYKRSFILKHSTGQGTVQVLCGTLYHLLTFKLTFRGQFC